MGACPEAHWARITAKINWAGLVIEAQGRHELDEGRESSHGGRADSSRATTSEVIGDNWSYYNQVTMPW